MEIVVISNDNVLSSDVSDFAKEVFGSQTSVQIIFDKTKAKAASARGGFDNATIVLDAELPETMNSPQDRTETVALSFLQDLRKEGIEAPVVVIISRTMGTSDIERTAIERYCVPNNKAIALPRRRLSANTLAGLIGMLQKKIVKTWDVIEIDVRPRLAKCHLRDQNGRTIEWAEASVSPHILHSLAMSYAKFNRTQGWSRQIFVDGATLFDELIGKTLGRALLSHLEKAAGGLSSLFFRFRIEEPLLFTAPFEATVRVMTDASDSLMTVDFDNNPFVLIHAPVSRRMSTGRLLMSEPVSDIRRPAKVLFIRSQMGEHLEGATVADAATVPQGGPASGAQPIVREFERLYNIDLELELLTELERQRPKAFSIKMIDLSEERDPAGAEAVLTRALAAKGGYDIVHFAGHSWTSDDQKSTVLILPGNKPGEAERMDIQRFAEAASKAQPRLIYLSSCRGSSANTVASLAQRDVAHVIGFRWDVEDKGAADFANKFYTALFDSPEATISGAFRTACSKVYPAQLPESNPIWASAILATLSDDWTRQGAT